MAEETNTETQKTPPEINPYVAHLAKDIGISMEKILEPEEPEPEPEGPVIIPDPVGSPRPPKPEEIPSEKEGEPEEPADQTEGKNGETKAEEKPKEKPEEKVEDTRPIIKLVKKTPVNMTPTPEQPSEEERRQQEEERAYIESLSPEQQDVLELARYAESKGKKGIYQQTLDYFRKLDKKAAENPSEDELAAFIEENKPKWNEAERRRYERQMITEQAVARAREEARREKEEIERKVKELEIKPLVEKTLTTLDDTLTQLSKAPTDGTDLIPIDKDDLKRIKEMPFQQAIQTKEGAIYYGAQNAIREFMAISNGARHVDEKNQTHVWLIDFIAREGHRVLRGPKEKQIRDGRKFMPMHEYLALQRENPDEAAAFWTFTQEDVIERIQESALKDYTAHVKALEAQGWKRQKSSPSEVPKQEKKQEPPPAPTGGGSPRAGARAVPGATDVPSSGKKVSELFPHLKGVESLTGRD